MRVQRSCVEKHAGEQICTAVQFWTWIFGKRSRGYKVKATLTRGSAIIKWKLESGEVLNCGESVLWLWVSLDHHLARWAWFCRDVQHFWKCFQGTLPQLRDYWQFRWAAFSWILRSLSKRSWTNGEERQLRETFPFQKKREIKVFYWELFQPDHPSLRWAYLSGACVWRHNWIGEGMFPLTRRKKCLWSKTPRFKNKDSPKVMTTPAMFLIGWRRPKSRVIKLAREGRNRNDLSVQILYKLNGAK